MSAERQVERQVERQAEALLDGFALLDNFSLLDDGFLSHKIIKLEHGRPCMQCMHEKGGAACGNIFCKNRFCGLQMVQFEWPQVIHPLVSYTFGVNSELPFHWMQEKEKAACGLLEKCKFIGFLDCKCSDLNAPGSYTL